MAYENSEKYTAVQKTGKNLLARTQDPTGGCQGMRLQESDIIKEENLTNRRRT